MNNEKYDPFAVPENYDPHEKFDRPVPELSFWAKLSASPWANALMFLLAIGAATAVIYLPRYLNPPQADKFETVGFPFPVFQVEALFDGMEPKDFTSFQLVDRVTLLTFWGPWNPQSVKQQQALIPIVKRFADDSRFQLLSVAYPENQIVGPQSQRTDEGKSLLELYPQSSLEKKIFRDKTNLLLQSLDITNKNVYWDPEGMLANAFYLSQPAGKQQFCIPMAIIVDQQKTIRAVWLGYDSGVETQIANQLEACLKDARAIPVPRVSSKTRDRPSDSGDQMTSSGDQTSAPESAPRFAPPQIQSGTVAGL